MGMRHRFIFATGLFLPIALVSSADWMGVRVV
jgi:hypothetical protein